MQLPTHLTTPHPAFGHPLPSRATGEGRVRGNAVKDVCTAVCRENCMFLARESKLANPGRAARRQRADSDARRYDPRANALRLAATGLVFLNLDESGLRRSARR
jgi:hypothetical protein